MSSARHRKPFTMRQNSIGQTGQVLKMKCETERVHSRDIFPGEKKTPTRGDKKSGDDP